MHIAISGQNSRGRFRAPTGASLASRASLALGTSRRARVSQRARVSLAAFALLAACLAFSGCAFSPEAKEARYLESGKKQLTKKDYARAIIQFRNAANSLPKTGKTSPSGVRTCVGRSC